MPISEDPGGFDETAIRRSLELFSLQSASLFDFDQLIEIRLWQRPTLEGMDRIDPAKKDEIPLRGFFDNLDAAVQEIKRYDEDDKTVGVFVVLNQIDPDSIEKRKIKIDNKIGKGLSTRDQDIRRRRWLPLDFDPERPAGTMATDQEKQAAKKAQAIINDILIKQHGWPDPVVVDSGNGYHDLFRVDLPNDNGSKQLIRDFFKALNKLLPDDLRGLAKVDEVPHNAGRVIKLPGTVVRKASSEGRPWRRSKILYVPAEIHQNIVTEGHLRAVIDEAGIQVKTKKERASTGLSGPSAEYSTPKKVSEHSGTKSISDLAEDPKIRDCIRQKILDMFMSQGSATWNHSTRLAILAELILAGYSDQAVHEVFKNFGESYSYETTQKNITHCRSQYVADGGSFWTCQELEEAGVIGEEICAICPSRKPEVEMPKVDPDDDLGQDLLDRVVRVEEATKDRPFGVGSDGIAYKRVTKDKAVFFVKIADGFCFIESQMRRDNGDATFTIRGRGSQDGHEFCFDLPGADFSDPRKLKAKLTSQFGGRNCIKKDFGGEAIQRLSKRIKDFRLVEACRWIDGKAAVPGLGLVPDLKFAISQKVPASFEDRGDLGQGVKSLKALMQAWNPGHMAIMAASVFGAPVAAQWFTDDRFGLALIGLTGTGKTEVVKLLMAIYGRGYLQDGNLIRWNDGATANAIQQIAAQSGFLPVLIDNYKPIKNSSAAQLVGLLHAILEGSEKSRLDRSAQLRSTLEFNCLPIITGESYVEETSTLARSILIEWQPVIDTAKLTEAQSQAAHLVEVGRSWLTWLSGDEGRAVVEEVQSGYEGLRSEAVAALNEAGCINAGRVGSSVAVIKSLWLILIRHPVLGEIFKPYSTTLAAALLRQMVDQAEGTVSANEGERFVSALRELVTSGRGVIVQGVSGLRSNTAYGESLYQHPERILGWRDDEGKTWLYPDATKRMVAQHLGRQPQDLDPRTIHRQLRDRGYLDIDENQKQVQQLRRDPASQKKMRFLVFKAEVDLGDLPDGVDQVDLTQAEEKVQESEEAQAIDRRMSAVCRIS